MSAAPRAAALLLGASVLLATPRNSEAKGGLRTFSVYSETLRLRPGEVHNGWVKPMPLPKEVVDKFENKTMHMKSLQLDIVRIDAVTGKERSLPLSEVYNHHHALLVGSARHLEELYNRSKGHDPLAPGGGVRPHGRGCMMHGAAVNEFLEELAAATPLKDKVAAFGGASGAEFRGTSTELPAPFTSATTNPQSFMALIHFINMRGAPLPSKRRFECPCTSARKINVTNGTVDGLKPVPFECSLELLYQRNPSCSLATYQGGYRCCEDGVFLSEEVPGPEVPADEIQAKFTFNYYEEAVPGARPVRKPSCCDATGNLTHKGNLEYDVPQCAPGTPPETCEHVISSIQYVDIPFGHRRNHSAKVDPDELVDLVHAWGHQHVGGLGMELYDEQTGQLLCRTHPRYGTGSAAGDEAGFVVGIPPCVWGPPPLPPPPRLRRGDLLRTVARYNSSQARHGVMSLWLMSAAPVVSRAAAGQRQRTAMLV